MSATLPNAESTSPESALPLRLERREEDRWPLAGVATACRIAGERFGEMHELRTLDYSHGGLGAISREPIEPGVTLSIGFSTPGYVAKRGTVITCMPCGDGYRVSIAFENQLAA